MCIWRQRETEMFKQNRYLMWALDWQVYHMLCLFSPTFIFFFIPQLELWVSPSWWDVCVHDHLASLQVFCLPALCLLGVILLLAFTYLSDETFIVCETEGIWIEPSLGFHSHPKELEPVAGIRLLTQQQQLGMSSLPLPNKASNT